MKLDFSNSISGLVVAVSVVFFSSECFALQKEKITEENNEAFFEQKVLPILSEHCFKCHGGKKTQAEFVLTNREDLLAGGETGAAIDLENPDESLLLSAINYLDYEMPPDGKLPAADIETLTTWVRMGVPWKGEGLKPERHAKKMEPPVNEQNKQWWSYQPVKRPELPSVRNREWMSNEIDLFVLARLEAAGLTPAAPATPQVLIRRLYYDLIGLPPTPEEVREFSANYSPQAYEKLVDRLLASPQYGEKWARHWLDLVRYAESNSYERDGTKPFVWKYRDYVIRSLNDDKPFSQFIREQIAGDEIEPVTNESIIATGYYRLGKWDDEPVSQEQAWYDDMDDVLATTSQVFLGMTINCARCHNHKIDPIPQADYYRMLAFFRNVHRYGVRSHKTVLDQSVRQLGTPEEIQNSREEVIHYDGLVKSNAVALKKIENKVKKDFIPVEHEEFKHERNRVALVKKRIGTVIDEETARRYEELTRERDRLRANPPKALDQALAVKEISSKPRETFITIRGNAKARGDVVTPGFPQILSPPEPVIQPVEANRSTGRRRALAQWIASDTNPLTARVAVNRIWQHHFGRGIVRSASDFGFQGTKPTHPELLDWLAVEFVQNGWRMKSLHKKMLMSSTYRMGSGCDQSTREKDPLNHLYSRFDMRRLTAEEVRDSILTVVGQLNPKMFGPSIYPIIPREVLQGQSRPGDNWNTSRGDELDRRSIYIHLKRSLPVPLMASFDVADTDSSCPVRFNTTQPSQALTMINSDYLKLQSERFAARLRKAVGDDRQTQVTQGLELVLQRQPSDKEIQRGVNFMKQLVEVDKVPPKQALDFFCLMALNMNEFIYLD